MTSVIPPEGNPIALLNDPKKKQRGQGSEARRVSERLNGFDFEQSEVWKAIKEKFSSGITHTELKSVAQLVCLKTGLKLDRDASRDNRVLIKWFEENWSEIENVVDKIQTYDENETPITNTREIEGDPV